MNEHRSGQEPHPLADLDAQARARLDAAVLQRLLAHLQKYPEVQNIDLMNLAYFCRNCLSKWYVSAAGEQGVPLDYDSARELVYGMPYGEYKERHQRPATPEQLEALGRAERKASV